MIRLTSVFFSLVLALLPVSPPQPQDQYHWVRLNGPWVMTRYHEKFIGSHHRAYWNGRQCRDATRPNQKMPSTVTPFHLGVALPGPEFYCVPVRICYRDRCVIATAVDVARDYRLKHKGQYYSHIDLWPATARTLGVHGIVYSNDIRVNVGVLKDGID